MGFCLMMKTTSSSAPELRYGRDYGGRDRACIAAVTEAVYTRVRQQVWRNGQSGQSRFWVAAVYIITLRQSASARTTASRQGEPDQIIQPYLLHSLYIFGMTPPSPSLFSDPDGRSIFILGFARVAGASAPLRTKRIGAKTRISELTRRPANISQDEKNQAQLYEPPPYH